ncbi:hypothetical protein AMTRI_Chr13g88430 [Amborella trichopoda]
MYNKEHISFISFTPIITSYSGFLLVASTITSTLLIGLIPLEYHVLVQVNP